MGKSVSVVDDARLLSRCASFSRRGVLEYNSTSCRLWIKSSVSSLFSGDAFMKMSVLSSLVSLKCC